ncbi:MAG: hypothetical protein JHD16_16525 [Solirubrobacteraceae bacterium]|nr:hypothetical protein [Solirubrobacteraceae bacterium]
MAPLVVGFLASDPATAALVSTVVLTGTASWLEYLRRTRPRVEGDDFRWFDERLEAYRPSLVGGAVAAIACVAVVAALAVSDDGLDAESLAWFVGVGGGIVAGSMYGRFFLTWLDDGAVGVLPKVVATTSWLAVPAPLVADKMFPGEGIVAIASIGPAVLCCVVLELCRRDAVPKRMAALVREGREREVRLRYGASVAATTH